MDTIVRDCNFAVEAMSAFDEERSCSEFVGPADSDSAGHDVFRWQCTTRSRLSVAHRPASRTFDNCGSTFA